MLVKTTHTNVLDIEHPIYQTQSSAAATPAGAAVATAARTSASSTSEIRILLTEGNSAHLELMSKLPAALAAATALSAAAGAIESIVNPIRSAAPAGAGTDTTETASAEANEIAEIITAHALAEAKAAIAAVSTQADAISRFTVIAVEAASLAANAAVRDVRAAKAAADTAEFSANVPASIAGTKAKESSEITLAAAKAAIKASASQVEKTDKDLAGQTAAASILKIAEASAKAAVIQAARAKAATTVIARVIANAKTTTETRAAPALKTFKSASGLTSASPLKIFLTHITESTYGDQDKAIPALLSHYFHMEAVRQSELTNMGFRPFGARPAASAGDGVTAISNPLRTVSEATDAKASVGAAVAATVVTSAKPIEGFEEGTREFELAQKLCFFYYNHLGLSESDIEKALIRYLEDHSMKGFPEGFLNKLIHTAVRFKGGYFHPLWMILPDKLDHLIMKKLSQNAAAHINQQLTEVKNLAKQAFLAGSVNYNAIFTTPSFRAKIASLTTLIDSCNSKSAVSKLIKDQCRLYEVPYTYSPAEFRLPPFVFGHNLLPNFIETVNKSSREFVEPESSAYLKVLKGILETWGQRPTPASTTVVRNPLQAVPEMRLTGASAEAAHNPFGAATSARADRVASMRLSQSSAAAAVAPNPMQAAGAAAAAPSPRAATPRSPSMLSEARERLEQDPLQAALTLATATGGGIAATVAIMAGLFQSRSGATSPRTGAAGTAASPSPLHTTARTGLVDSKAAAADDTTVVKSPLRAATQAAAGTGGTDEGAEQHNPFGPATTGPKA